MIWIIDLVTLDYWFIFHTGCRDNDTNEKFILQKIFPRNTQFFENKSAHPSNTSGKKTRSHEEETEENVALTFSRVTIEINRPLLFDLVNRVSVQFDTQSQCFFKLKEQWCTICHEGRLSTTTTDFWMTLETRRAFGCFLVSSTLNSLTEAIGSIRSHYRLWLMKRLYLKRRARNRQLRSMAILRSSCRFFASVRIFRRSCFQFSSSTEKERGRGDALTRCQKLGSE